MDHLSWRFSASHVEAALQTLLPPPPAHQIDGDERGLALLQNAMRYATLGEGKRTRPLLLLEAAHVVNPEADWNRVMQAACAVELIHAYSLVHDDLPAMDDADVRRGKASCHKEYGEAMAILAGDGLQTLAFEAAANTGNIRFVSLLAGAAGACGMAGGQAIDIEWTHDSDGHAVSGDALLHLHALKTGAMIRVSAEGGALLAGGDEEQISALRAFGTSVGRAFQIWDDVLDADGDPNITGKSATDAQNDKITAVGIWGLDGAKKRALQASDAAVAALEHFGSEADTLRALAHFVVERNK